MSKIIRVESCAGCDKDKLNICDKVAICNIKEKTIPDDCPLDDDKVQILKARYKKLEDRLYSVLIPETENIIRRDATKHIRVVSDWKPIINPYDFDVNELAILHNGLLEAIKADLEDKEAE